MTDTAAAETEAVLAELTRLADIAAGILDGEEVKAIVNPRALAHIARPDPEHPFLAGDYFDVDHAMFLRTKKMLLRIARLSDRPVSGSAWVPVPESEQVTVAVHNGAHHRYYRFGQAGLDTPAEMKEVFRSGQVQAAPPDAAGRLATALAPIRDSLGDVVAVAEFTAPLAAAPPAWS